MTELQTRTKYGYDDLTRLTGANCGTAWSGTYTFDPFGNIAKSGSMNFSASYSNSTNRMTLVGTFTPTYDANGNVLNDGAHTYTWDSDGNSITADGVGVTFDALDRAVEQNRSGSFTELVYGPGGDKLALMNGQTLVRAFVPLTGGATAVYTSAGLDHYRHTDWLGSNRLSSAPSRTVQWSGAYGPWGELYASSGSADPSFTGQNADTSSTGEYDFLYRQYGTQGRWPAPDRAGLGAADPSDPQSWNRYAYVRNRPLQAIDPVGLDCVWVDSDEHIVSVQRGDGDCSDHDGLVGFYVEGKVDQSSLGVTDNGDVFGTVDGNQFCSGSCDFHDSVTVTADPGSSGPLGRDCHTVYDGGAPMGNSCDPEYSQNLDIRPAPITPLGNRNLRDASQLDASLFTSNDAGAGATTAALDSAVKVGEGAGKLRRFLKGLSLDSFLVGVGGTVLWNAARGDVELALANKEAQRQFQQDVNACTAQYGAGQK